MKIFDEIEKMESIIEKLTIDKFLNFDIINHNCDIDDGVISIEIILKEKADNTQSSIKYEISKYKIDISVILAKWYGNSYGSNKYVKFNKEIKIQKLPYIFLSEQNKKFKDKINELFYYKINETKYKNYKFIIENQLDNKDIRKIKLDKLENNTN